ncbi:MAG TPA: hypothetical protein VMZ71_09810, partial [Gemmataceae bacterium]|nr:hypothetical protein [Gemmataceae bacterium]
EDLPMAEELPDDEQAGESSLFPQNRRPADRFGDDDDAHDYGATPKGTADASNILADLSDGEIEFDHDASGVRLDSPGMERTLSDEPPPSGTTGGTAIEPVPRRPFPAKSPPPDWQPPSGAGLFSDDHTVADDDDVVNPFTDAVPDQPSLGSAQSSIFSGGKVPGGSGTVSGSDDLRPRAKKPAADFPSSSDDALGDDASILDAPALDENATAAGDGGIDFDRPKRGRRDPSGSDPDERSMGEPGDEWIVADVRTGTKPVPDNRPPKVTPKGKGKAAPLKGRKASDPSVVVDFVSQSAEESPVGVKAAARKNLKEKPAKGGGMLVGGLVGVLAGVGACAGLYFGGVLDKPAATTGPNAGQVGTPNGGGSRAAQPQAATPTVADAHKALAGGDPAAALKAVEAAGADTAEAKAARGQARMLVRLRDATAIGATDAELTKAREDLQAAMDDPAAATAPEAQRAAVKAAVHLGLTHELAGNRAEARKVYEAAQQKFPKASDVFQAALDRLSATDADAGKTSLLPRDAEQLALAATFLLTLPQETTDAGDEPAEAGGHFWKALNSATAGKYLDAIDKIGQAKAAHVKRAKALAGRGLNPLSDPLEQIFPKCCDELKAYWELRGAVYGHKYVAGQAKTPAELKKMFDQMVTFAEGAKVMQKDLQGKSDELLVKGRELKIAGETITKLTEEAKKAADAQKVTDAARVAAESTVAALAKELQAGKFLPEKFEPAAILPAQKEAVSRAGLVAGDLVKLGERVKTSEAAAKAATDKLAADTKALKDAQAAEMKKLTDAHAVEVKKFLDNPIADKLKADHAVEVKKLGDAHTAAMKKASDDHAAAVKALEGAVAAEKERLVAMAKKFEADLGNSVSPTQTLDIWLPLLNTARRPADADPALAAAAKVLATAPKDSEDAAKALAVSGLATQIKGSVATARGMFAAARANPTYSPSKDWGKIVDAALGRIEDPTGASAVADPLKKNPAAAARLLDAGIAAYKAGRFADAAKALAEASTNDATNPLVWYYLGAARWQSGNRELASVDFRTGAERESSRTMSAKAINDALAPIQGPVRDALTNARP